jgi:hypothetical protein
VREETQPAGIDEQCLSVWSDEKERVALSYIDCLKEKGVGWVVRLAGPDCYGGHQRKGQTRNPPESACGSGKLDGEDKEQDGERDLKRSRLWDANVAKGECSQSANDGQAQVKNGEADGCRDNGYRRPEGQREQNDQRDWDEQAEQGEDEEIYGEGVDSDSMEVHGHWQGQSQFYDEGNEDDFAEAEGGADDQRQEAPGDSGVGCTLQMLGDEAQGYAKLCDLRWQFCVEGDQCEVACGADSCLQGSLQEGDCGSCDGGDGEHGHLQAGVEDAAGA